MKPANAERAEPVEGSGASSHGTMARHQAGDFELLLLFPEGPRIAYVAKPRLEEPDALIAHVRICGSPGRATALKIYEDGAILQVARYLIGGSSRYQDRRRPQMAGRYIISLDVHGQETEIVVMTETGRVTRRSVRQGEATTAAATRVRGSAG